jgi:hypothetical protein
MHNRDSNLAEAISLIAEILARAYLRLRRAVHALRTFHGGNTSSKARRDPAGSSWFWSIGVRRKSRRLNLVPSPRM